MAKRYYLCEIIGDGSEDDPFRPAVADIEGINWTGEWASDPKTGHPTSTHALVKVAAKNHARLIADQRVRALPDFPLDGKMNAMNQSAQTALNQALSRFGISSGTTQADGYRQVIRNLGKNLNQNFDENNFDVSE